MKFSPKHAGLAVALLLASAAARAEVDLAPITAAGADVAKVGAAAFAVYIAAKVFKWIRRAT